MRDTKRHVAGCGGAYAPMKRAQHGIAVDDEEVPNVDGLILANGRVPSTAGLSVMSPVPAVPGEPPINVPPPIVTGGGDWESINQRRRKRIEDLSKNKPIWRDIVGAALQFSPRFSAIGKMVAGPSQDQRQQQADMLASQMADDERALQQAQAMEQYRRESAQRSKAYQEDLKQQRTDTNARQGQQDFRMAVKEGFEPTPDAQAVDATIIPGEMLVPKGAIKAEAGGRKGYYPSQSMRDERAQKVKQASWVAVPPELRQQFPELGEKASLETIAQYRGKEKKDATSAGETEWKNAVARGEFSGSYLDWRKKLANLRPPPVGSLGSTDAKDIANAIAGGDQPPTLTGLYRNAGPVRAELARMGYDLTSATRDWQAVQRHISTLNGPQQERLRQAVTFTYDSLDVIDDLYKEWTRTALSSGYKTINKAVLAVTKQLPGKAGSIAQNLEAQINDLTAELGTVYKGGNSSTDESLKLAAQNLKADWNKETFEKALNQIRRNLQIRKNSIMQSRPVGVSEGSPYPPPVPQQEGRGEKVKDPLGIR